MYVIVFKVMCILIKNKIYIKLISQLSLRYTSFVVNKIFLQKYSIKFLK